jgi:DNA helicase HerA-like ATPase
MTFEDDFRAVYGFDAPAIDLGHILRDGTPLASLPVRIPLRMMNRHGMIAGSTGTGKTRTLQLLAEGLSRAGVPVFVSDVKGDLAGMSVPGDASDRLKARAQSVGLTYTPEAFPTEFFSLTGTKGIQVRATVTSFGPILLGKILDLTDTQQSVLALVFKYCDDRKLPLLDFDDLRGVLNYLTTDGKEDLKQYGGMSAATVGVLVRKMVELEQQGAAKFFGEPELDINDLMRTANGRGVVNILSLADVQDKPRLYSAFLMWLLGQFYYRMPEVGDPDKPKLVFFFDEAHQLFADASSALVQYIEQVSRLIRSKGIGVFFITQTPKDVDEDVLAQLGNRVQHAFRVFTPKDAKNLKAIASTFPPSEHVDVAKQLTNLGVGEGLVTVLNPKGVPTEVAPIQVLAPASSMAAIDDAQYQRVMSGSALAPKYATAINRESAHEILQRKMAESETVEEPQVRPGDDFDWRQTSARRPPASRRAEPADYAPAPRRSARSRKEPKGVIESALESRMAQNIARQATRTVTQSIVRGIFGMLKGR